MNKNINILILLFSVLSFSVAIAGGHKMMKDRTESQVGIAAQDLSNWSIKQILNKTNNFLALTRSGYQWRYTEDHIKKAKKELMENDNVLARISAEKAYNEARLAYNQSRKHDSEIETAFPSSK